MNESAAEFSGPPPPAQSRRAARILVVDDEQILRELVRAVLDGYEFVEAADGEEALELARRERPDLIVLDVMLPRRSGLEVLADLRRDRDLARTPVVVITAWSHAEASAAAVGADAFVPKPFDPDMLRGVVEELLAR